MIQLCLSLSGLSPFGKPIENSLSFQNITKGSELANRSVKDPLRKL